VTIPLTGKPPKKTFAWMECDVPTCASYLTPGIKDATAALGWDLKIIPMKSTDPGPAIQQAIDAGVDYISLTGVPVAAFQAQADAAKAKGIPILSCFATDAPSEESNVLMQCGDESFVKKTGPIMADWAIADSNGAANVLIVTIRDFPVLVSEEDAYKAELAKNCPDCKVDTLNVTLDDLIGGKGAGGCRLEAADRLRDQLRVQHVRRPPGGPHRRSQVGWSRQAGHGVRPGLQQVRPRRDRCRHDGCVVG
jgi:ribose transport system substrate-binding protein